MENFVLILNVLIFKDIHAISAAKSNILKIRMKVKVLVAQSCPTLCDSMDCM